MSGSLKGCAADVEVAAGLPWVRGLVAVVTLALTGFAEFLCEVEMDRDVA